MIGQTARSRQDKFTEAALRIMFSEYAAFSDALVDICLSIYLLALDPGIIYQINIELN